jgi:hypothetical protein
MFCTRLIAYVAYLIFSVLLSIINTVRYTEMAIDRFMDFWVPARHGGTESRDLAHAREEQAARYQDDPWQEPIGKYLKRLNDVSVSKILAEGRFGDVITDA